MEKTIKQIEPIKKSQEKVIYTDGSQVLRCYAPHNPHYYEEDGVLKAINLSHITEAITKIGKCRLRSKNIVSVGFRDDNNPKKYLGLRPDFCQKSGEEQLEFSIEKIEFDGKEIPIDLSKNKVINSVTVDLGNVFLVSNRQRTRQIVKVNSNISDFKIIYRMHLKGLKVKYQKDLGEYWIYSANNDEFRFRIVKPSILDAETHQPIFSEVGENFRGLVKHSLIKQKDGTYFYIKESTKEFIKAKLLAPYLIDADTYYSNTNDSAIYYEHASWSVCRGADTGDNVYTGDTYPVQARHYGTPQNEYRIQRGFLSFDTSDADYPTAVDYKCYVHSIIGSESNHCVMKGIQADVPTVADYDSFSGLYYVYTGLSVTGWRTFTFNPQGISDINIDGYTKICHRQYGYDYSNTAPGYNTAFGASCRSYDYTGTTYDPYLLITEGTPPAMRINIGDSWKAYSEVKINIGDSWKTVTEMKINVGDVWKTIF